MSVIRPPDCSKLARNPKNNNNVTIFRHNVNVTFFDVVLFLLSSLVTGRSFMSISSLVLELSQFSFIRDWPEIRKSENTLVWVLPNIWRLGRVMDTKFDANVCNRMLLNAAQFKGNSFCRFWVINGKPTGGQNYPPSPLPSRLGLIVNLWHTCLFL